MDLKTVRVLRGMTQIELMKISGVYHTRISQIEKGHFNATRKERKAIEKALDVKAGINWGGEQ